MSQAHYLRCSHEGRNEQHDLVVAGVRGQTGRDYNLCLRCLDEVLDFCDDRPEVEPVFLLWAWDAGTRMCPLHHWPDVVCRDWSAEHAALIRALQTPTGG